uniref:Cyclic nucleotide-binding domain-containing protein n=1 Tax=Bodo saltans TaxID=75058 RepID=B6DTH5_BODSA|nr:hypothetical protein [Bodo saltans]
MRWQQRLRCPLASLQVLQPLVVPFSRKRHQSQRTTATAQTVSTKPLSWLCAIGSCLDERYPPEAIVHTGKQQRCRFSSTTSNASQHYTTTMGDASNSAAQRASITTSSAANASDVAARQSRVQLKSLITTSRARCIGAKFPLSEALLKLSWLFQCLPPHALSDVLKSVRPLCVPAGTKLATAGESNRRWFFVRRGRCVIFPNSEGSATAASASDGAKHTSDADHNGHTNGGVGGVPKSPQKRRSTFSASGVPVYLESGCSIGELSLIFEEPRSHTIEAATMCDLWVLEQSSFSEILAGDESIRATCQRKGAVLRAKWLAAQRRSPALLEILRNCPLFRDCWSDVLYSLLLDAIEPMVLPQRTLITSAAAFADKLMILVKGTASSQRGDVPVTFGPGSIIGGACFVRHRWPLAIATTSIVDCWAFTAEKLKWIAHRLDLLQTVSHWEPENERGKYLTKIQEVYPGGRLVPTETMGYLRRALHLSEKELIPVLPVTPAGARHKGERRTSFVAHFRHVSMNELEELCVRYPDSFNMSNLLFRTSYGSEHDHLRKQFLVATNRAGDKVVSSDSQDEGYSSASMMSPVPEGTKRSEAEINVIAAANAHAMRRRQRRMAFERGLRRQIKQIVGEPLSNSSHSSSPDDNGSDGAPDVELKKFKAHRRTHKHHGVGSGVLSHVDDGTVMNSAQLAADQIVMRRVLRDQRRKERQGLSSANALMFNPAFVFNGQRAMSSGGGGGSFFLSQTMSSHSMAFSEDDRSGSIAGDSDTAGSMMISRSALDKAATPSGAQEWETELKAIFAAGDDVIPTLRDMSRLFKLRSKKLRQRIKAKAQPAAALGASQGTASQLSEAMAASKAKRAKEIDALFSAVDDAHLHECVHSTDPEVNIGFASQQHLRHVISVSASQRLPFLVGKEACASAASKLQRVAAAEDAEENPAVERTKMLLQLFRSGYANRTKSNSHGAAGTGESGGEENETTVRRRTRGLSAQNGGGGDEASVSPSTTLLNPHHDKPGGAGGGILESMSLAESPRSSPQTITISIPDVPHRDGDIDNGSGPQTRVSSLAASPLRRKSTIGPQLRKTNSDVSVRAQSMVYNASQFPSKALFFEHVARELLLRLSADPELSIEALQQRLQSGGWTDTIRDESGNNDIHVEFEAFVEQIRQKQQHHQTLHESQSGRRQSSFIMAPPSLLHRNSTGPRGGGSPNPSAPSTPTGEASASNSRISSPRLTSSSVLFQGFPHPHVAEGIAIDGGEDHHADDGDSRVATPVTPRSCGSPALSDLNWCEFDTYLLTTAEEDAHGTLLVGSQIGLRGSLNQSTGGGGGAAATTGGGGGRRKTLRRVQQNNNNNIGGHLLNSSFSPLASYDSAGQLSIAESDNSETPSIQVSTHHSAAITMTTATNVAATNTGAVVGGVVGSNSVGETFESRLMHRDVHSAADPTTSTNNAAAVAALFRRADALRRGETRSELLELLEQNNLDGYSSVWVDGVGVMPVGVATEETDRVEFSAEALEARKALRFAGRNGRGGAGRGHQIHIEGAGGSHDDFYDDDMRGAASPALSHAASALQTRDGSRRQSTGSAQNDPLTTGTSRLRQQSFPDLKETNMMIKRLERLADNLSLGVYSKNSHAADTFDSDKLNHSERQQMKVAVEEIRFATSQTEATTSSTFTAPTANRHSRGGMTGGTDADATHSETRFHKNQRHWVVPWYLLQEAGHDYLAEALAETVPVSYKSKSGDSDDDDADDENDDVDGDREQVVLVGARQFGLQPRPLTKALPPLWGGLEDDEGEGGAATKIEQLLSYAAFADAGSLSHSEQHQGLHNVLSAGSLPIGSHPSSGGGVGFFKAKSTIGNNHGGLAQSVNEQHASPQAHNDMAISGQYSPNRIQSIASFVSMPSTPIPSQPNNLVKRKLKSFLTSTLAIPSVREAVGSTQEKHQRHEERMSRLCEDVARRHRRSTSFPSSAVLSQLPALPITANMAVLQLPHEVTPRGGVRSVSEFLDSGSGATPRQQKVMQWKSLRIPV